ncbi:PE family protein, partial [Mycobacterium intermedium]
MSFLITTPDLVSKAAADVGRIGASIFAANFSAQGPTSTLVAAAEDEVSAAIAELFRHQARAYQAASAQVAAFHAQFVRALGDASGAYAAAEAAAANPLQIVGDNVLGVI